MRKYYWMMLSAVALVAVVGLQWDGGVSAETTNPTTIYMPKLENYPCNKLKTNEDLDEQYHHANMNNERAWSCITSGEGVIVAVIDTGVDRDHYDLEANLLVGETFVGAESSYEDDQGHGTHVAGIVGAVANNGGVVGTAPKAKVLPIRSLSRRGGTARDVAEGIFHAVDNGADIINLSLGSRHPNDVMKEAIDYAFENDVLIIAAAGNCGDPENWSRQGCKWHNVISYPAAYSEVMAVAATDDNEENSHAVFSTQGPQVEVAAPGRNILSTWRSEAHAAVSGTSMASPNAAGVAALIMSEFPDLTSQEVRLAMKLGAVDLGTYGVDHFFGYGIVDSYRTILAIRYGLLEDASVTSAETNVQPVALEDITPDEYVAGDIVIKLEDGVSLKAVQQATPIARSGIAMQMAATDLDRNLYQVTVAPGQELDAIRILRQMDGVQYAEPNFIIQTY